MTRLQKKINYFKPRGTLYRNPLLNAVEAQRQKTADVAKGFTEKVVSGFKEPTERRRAITAKARKRTNSLNDVVRIQDELYRQGYFGNLDYNKAVDGVWGKATQDAYNKRRLGQKTSKPTANNKEVVEETNQNSNLGNAIYVHYPNFKGQAANAAVVGGVDVGKKVFGTKSVLPVGHDELITFDSEGNGQLVRYGRYTSGIGHVRPTVKGGNWNIIKLPKRNEGESAQDYLTRNKSYLEDSKYGTFEGTEVPNVDVQKVLNYAREQANNKNRSEYNLSNTCATGASNALRAGLSPEQLEKMDEINLNTSKADNDILTTLWGLIPGSTQSYNRKVYNIGKTSIIK